MTSPSHEWLGYFQQSAEWGVNAAGATGRVARRTMLGDDGNQTGAHSRPSWPGFNAKAQSRKVRKADIVFLCALAPLRLCVDFSSGDLPEVLADGHQLNYAVKSRLLLSFLESVPNVSAKLKAPVTADRKFEDVVKSARGAAVLVLVF